MSLNNFIVLLKTVSCVLLLTTANIVKAEAEEAILPLENKEEPQSEPSVLEAFPEDELAEDTYNIYKKSNPADPCDRGQDTYDYEKSWYDETQIYVNSKFCEPALWFDNFFGSDRLFEEGAAGTYIRWRNEFTIDEEESTSFKTGISASVELPGLQDRLRLTFDSEEDEDLRDVAPGSSDDTRSTLGLQLDVKENARSKFSVSLNFTPRIRFRYRYTYPITDALTLRLTQEVQREKKLHSARTLFDFEHLFGEQFLFRASTEGKVSEAYDGVDWLQAFVFFQRVSKKTSLSYEASVSGITEPQTIATNYRTGVRYRKNFHRKWLFYEIAPELTWPITYDDERQVILKDRRSKWLLFFRLEVHFGNAYKKRYQDYI